jgi:hypothetical protein
MSVAGEELKVLNGALHEENEKGPQVQTSEMNEDTENKGSESPAPLARQITGITHQDSLEEPEDEEEEEEEEVDRDNVVLCEAALESTHLDKSRATAYKLKCLSITVLTTAIILFIFSFPFSLFLIFFCFNTKRSCLPFRAIRKSPWRLYLTQSALHYHLPNPPHRPYVNFIYCLKRVHKYTIPLKDIKSIAVQNPFTTEAPGKTTNSIAPPLEDIVIKLKLGSPGVNVPVERTLGLWSRRQTVHTLVIYSVKDASTFTDVVKQHID